MGEGLHEPGCRLRDNGPVSAPRASGPFTALPPQVDLPALERGILELWAERDTFEKSVERTADAEPWTFYEGPPTANGMPGTHHVEARVFKDVFPRFWTMRGRLLISRTLA